MKGKYDDDDVMIIYTRSIYKKLPTCLINECFLSCIRIFHNSWLLLAICFPAL